MSAKNQRENENIDEEESTLKEELNKKVTLDKSRLLVWEMNR